MLYFTADTHFNHASIIKLCGRPFENVEQMNSALIQNWNSCIGSNDEIYILGDFLFKGNGIEANNLLQSLNGKKYLIKGNHDKYLEDKAFNKNNFKWIKDYYVLSYGGKKFVLFHYPILEWEGYFKNAVHLYGHVHNSGSKIENKIENKIEGQNRLEILGKKAINVGVDVNNYSPVNIDEIIKMTD